LVVAISFALVAPSCGARSGLSVSSCSSFAAAAVRAELDVFIMLDASRSMEFVTDDGTSKARAVRDALADFLGAPASAGLGVGISFFPIIRPEVPDLCLDDDACGEPGACEPFGSLCVPSGAKQCTLDSDCADTGTPEDVCREIGGCSTNIDTICLTDGDPLVFCGPEATCSPLGICRNHSSCDPDDYATPVVEVTPLPQGRALVLLAIDTRVPEGGTPTLPALTGAIDVALSRRAVAPDHKAIVVLATDGMPTDCDPAVAFLDDPISDAGIAALLPVAQAGVAAGVQTFVVGVFAPDEEQVARANLDQIAEAGSTESAYIVTTDELVSQRLLEALDEIRRSAVACEYSIPWPADEGADPSTLGVQLGSERLERVVGLSGCDPTLGGFFFDPEPAEGVLPGRVVLCPATCERLGDPPVDSLLLEGGCSEATL
jgi:hypothetical protein